MTGVAADDEIRILYNGKQAFNVSLFAEKYGMSIDTARKTLSRLGVAPFDKPLDGHTKLWPAAAVNKAMKSRPGKGANLRGHG